MPWFAAHAIMYFRLKSGKQKKYTVYEDVYLVKGANPRQAWDRGCELGRSAEGDDDGSLTINGKPGERVFGGLRKVVTVFHFGTEDVLEDGDEITYSEFQVKDMKALRQLIKGKDVATIYME